MTRTARLPLADAKAFLKKHRRHYASSAKPIAAIGLFVGKTLHGAAILGETNAGHGKLAHIYVDGTWSGYSLLYGACWRAYSALGYDLIDPR